MSTIINGTSSAITFPDSTVQNSAGLASGGTIASGTITNGTITTLTTTTISDGTNSTSSTNCIKGSAKAWANFTGNTSSPLTVNNSYNVASITRNSLGNYTVTFTNSISGTYIVVPASAVILGAGVSQWAVGLVTSQTSSSFVIQYVGTNGANFDITTGTFAVFS